jgi:MoaA/NifB/PqqE/SkfB family radical SAM enzyme
MEELSTEEAKRLIDDSLKMGVTIIAFTGGEPLLRKDIYELVAHVDHRKAMPIMFTSGQFLTEENAAKLADAGLYSLFVSLDSTDPEEHDKWRGMPGLFNRAIEGLKLMKEKGVMINLSSYASRTGTEQNHYKKIHQLAGEIGAHNVILFDSVPTGAMLKDTSEVLTPEQREEITEFSEHIFNKGIVPAFSSQSWQNSIEGSLAGIGCLSANIQFYASAYGDIAPCDFTPLSFGNIREEPLRKIWKRMVAHPVYRQKVCYCRMQHPEFRKKYIDPIPEGAILPYPMRKVEETAETPEQSSEKKIASPDRVR